MVIFQGSLWANIPHAGEKRVFFPDSQKFTPQARFPPALKPPAQLPPSVGVGGLRARVLGGDGKGSAGDAVSVQAHAREDKACLGDGLLAHLRVLGWVSQS